MERPTAARAAAAAASESAASTDDWRPREEEYSSTDDLRARVGSSGGAAPSSSVPGTDDMRMEDKGGGMHARAMSSSVALAPADAFAPTATACWNAPASIVTSDARRVEA